jgi:hypothetical protein
MPTTLQCTQCGQSFAVPEAPGSNGGRCPHCQAEYPVAPRAAPGATRRSRLWLWVACGVALLGAVCVMAILLSSPGGSLELADWYTARTVRTGPISGLTAREQDEVFLVVTVRLSSQYLGRLSDDQWMTTVALSDFQLVTHTGSVQPPGGARQVMLGAPEELHNVHTSIGAPFFDSLVVTPTSFDGKPPDYSQPAPVTLLWLVKRDVADNWPRCAVRFKDHEPLMLTEVSRRSPPSP